MLSQANVFGMGAGGSGGIQTLERVKSEAMWTGMNWPIGSPKSLVEQLKGLPHSGSLAPFFNEATNLFMPQNFDSTCFFKINITGTWDAAGGGQYLTIDFPGSNGNNLVYSKAPAMDADIISISTFFSIDKDGNLATNGANIQIATPESNFTATEVKLIAEQLIWS